MSSEHSSAGVLVNSALVGQEIFVDGESDFDWSVGGDLGLHIGFASDGVWALAEPEVVTVGLAVGWVTGLGALWSAGDSWAIWVLRTGGVVSALGQEVWLTPRVVSVSVTGDETGVGEVLPGHGWVTSLTTETARRTTSQQVLGRDSDGLGLLLESHGLLLDANSVGHGFDGAEGPAGSAVGLVSDFLDGVTLWPVGSGIEGVSLLLQGFEAVLDFWELWAIESGSHEHLDLFEALLSEFVWSLGGPGGLFGVHFLSDVGESLVV